MSVWSARAAASRPPQREPVTTVPAAFGPALAEALERAGCSTRLAWQAAGARAAPPGIGCGAISPVRFEALCLSAMQALGDEALGWFSRPLPLGSHAMLCRASLPAPNLRTALARWCRHHGLLVGDVRIALHTEAGQAWLTVEERADLGRQRAFCLAATLSTLHGFACWLADDDIAVRSASFGFPAPDDAFAYEGLLGGPVQFGQPRTAVCFDAAWLDRPVLRGDSDLRRLLARPLPLLVHRPERKRLVSQRVRSLLRASAPQLATAPDLASALRLSVRSLHRHLAEEGATLQRLKNELRQGIAMDRLARSDKPLKQVASAAGYHSKASFNRAFRAWTGTSPAQYRQAGAARVD